MMFFYTTIKDNMNIYINFNNKLRLYLNNVIMHAIFCWNCLQSKCYRYCHLQLSQHTSCPCLWTWVCECECEREWVSLVIATKTAQHDQTGYCLIDAYSSPTCLCKYNQVGPSAKTVEKSAVGTPLPHSFLQKHPARGGFCHMCLHSFHDLRKWHIHTLVEMHKCHSAHYSATGCDSMSFIRFHFHTHFPSAQTFFFSKSG